MSIVVSDIEDLLVKLRENQPLVHNVTNLVTMNWIANSLLALGASPIMSHSREEADDLSTICNVGVFNIGTPDIKFNQRVDKIMSCYAKKHKPFILDPVGVGASIFRTGNSRELIFKYTPTVIKGNASEIKSLLDAEVTKGVDSTISTEHAIEIAKEISKRFNSVIVVSGEVDYIIYQEQVVAIHNGSKMMGKVTGMGCVAGAVIGAFLAVSDDPYLASVTAMGVMGISGELTEKNAKGPGSFAYMFLDTLYNLTPQIIKENLKLV